MAEQLTPLLLQYRRIKEKYRDAILLFRLGDFYEMFYDDAAIGARVLGLTLTSRSHGSANRVPLAGIPVKAVDSYIAKLVAAGYRVAVCEQLEMPGLTKLIRRDVVEVITPGTSLRPTLIPERQNQYLTALLPADDCIGFAYADISTGEFGLSELSPAAASEELQKFSPREVLYPKGSGIPDRLNLPELTYTPLDDYYFTAEFALERLTRHFQVASLEGFGVADKSCGVRAAGAILAYLEETQKSALPHIRKLTHHRSTDYLLIDRISRRNLELTERIRDGSTEGTLLSVLDRTLTPAGARLLRRWLLMPLLDTAAIQERQSAISELLRQPRALNELRTALRPIGDLERVAARIACERCNARECIALKGWLECVPAVKSALTPVQSRRLAVLSPLLEDHGSLVQEIGRTLVDDPPLAITEGGMIREGVSEELDQLRNLARGARDWIARLQESERRRTGIPNLKVGYNSVFGYYLEVTKSNLHLVPKNYLRKQTIANGERFITPELKEYESKVLHAEERIKALEYELFARLRATIAAEVPRLLSLAAVLAELDVLSSLALVALENNYVCPQITTGRELIIRGGRHPVVERLVPETFVPNDTILNSDDSQILIITGPNMAGKSTYLRQVALIVIMAQMGSFVPAAEARIGICDKIFTRIGASDDLARGVSTFLAEMIETANILNNATARSLVVLDEVGRGTATFDGLAIAWAVVEYLHENPVVRPKTLFATHYHELTDIANYLSRVRNYNFLVKESRDDIIFLRRLVPGKSDRSYGIAVAKLAGVPASVVARARQVLADFERGEQLSLRTAEHEVPTLRETNETPAGSDSRLTADMHSVLSELAALDINNLSPIQALNLLSEWQQRLSPQDPENSPLSRH